MSALDAVRGYGQRGWQVFPLIPTAKEPATRRGFYDATSNPAKLDRWFARGHPYNIGIRTGLASGVFILDTDSEDGAANLRALENKHGALPPTLISETSRGRHFWFRAECEIPSTGKNRIAPDIDIKAEGGYAVAPPSIHPDGKRYRWLNDLEVAPAPDWLIHLIFLVRRPAPVCPPPKPVFQRTISAGSSAAYGNAALEAEIENLVRASSGSRNHALNRTSFALHQLVGGAELHADIVQQRLLGAAEANGLIAENGLRTVQATITSGADAGLRYPRDRWGRR